MVAVKVSAFGGLIPSQDDRLLPDNNSAANENVFLDSGALQGMRKPRYLRSTSDPETKYVFRIPTAAPDRNHIESSYWWEFTDADTNVLKTPVANDAFERFYAVSPSITPQYNTKTRIMNGDASYTLGIPTPATAPVVNVVGGSGSTKARSYVTTWVSAYGEEGPPSPPTLVTGFEDGTWNVTPMLPTAPDLANRNLTLVRIYRTITNTAGGATYYLVAEQAIGAGLYGDVIIDLTLAGNTTLQSYDWGAPPTDMEGFVSMPNGMIVGWRGNEIWFCEPFRPHAWPSAYTTSIDANVVGLGVVGQTLVVCTDGFPYSATGINPANMAFSKIASHEPCASRGSIVSTAQGVFYASPNGIVLAAYGVVQNASAQLATKDRWLAKVRPETLRAARLGASYYAWGSRLDGAFYSDAFEPTAFEQFDVSVAYAGIMVNLIDPRIGWVDLASLPVTYRVPEDDFGTEATLANTNVMTDIWTGEIFVLRERYLYWIDPTEASPMSTYSWTSKKYHISQYRNLAAARVWFDDAEPAPGWEYEVEYPDDTVTPDGVPDGKYGYFSAYADGRLVMRREMRTSGQVMRLPSGFKAVFWQFKIEGAVKVFDFEVASTIKELAAV